MEPSQQLTQQNERNVYDILLSVRSQQLSALIETERALKALNPAFVRVFLSREERRALRCGQEESGAS